MLLPYTPLYAAFLALMYVGLSLKVISFRWSSGISLGYQSKDGQAHRELLKWSRAHANFAEYVPLALILIWALESIAYATVTASVLGGLLCVARIMHVIGITQTRLIKFRQIGMLMTFGVLLAAAVSLIIFYL